MTVVETYPSRCGVCDMPISSAESFANHSSAEWDEFHQLLTRDRQIRAQARKSRIPRLLGIVQRHMRSRVTA